MNNYEKSQYEAIKKWKSEEPSVVSQAVGSVFKPASWLIEKIIPSKAIEGVLSGCNMMAEWFCDIDDIKRDAKVNFISELKTKDLELSDKLANEVHNWAVAANAVIAVTKLPKSYSVDLAAMNCASHLLLPILFAARQSTNPPLTVILHTSVEVRRRK